MKSIFILVAVCFGYTANAADFANYFNRENSASTATVIQNFEGASLIQVNFGGSVERCNENRHKVVAALDASNKVIVKVTDCDGSKAIGGMIYFF